MIAPGRQLLGKVRYLSVLLLAGCSAQALPGPLEPAVLEEVTGAVRTELTQVVSEALGGVPVTLGEEVLTDTSILVVEQNVPRDLQQRPLAGRSLAVPVRFQLLVGDQGCWLKRLPEGPFWPLTRARCVREARSTEAGSDS
ncbi:hypothetical protein [Microbulbifer guangxiensis]|uniref:hypothetical protein n=1 Tax=Microbulbifer guangxiensis TaxID=2904249 RepID=UPI001F2B5CB2|nr:hypothetical protein [Microbulbifer guangxiensis]